MLVTEGFGWLLAINWAWLLLPFGIWFVSACLISWVDSRRMKAGKKSFDEVGVPLWHSAACIIAIGLLVLIPLANFALGPGPHYGNIKDDIEEQFNLTNVVHTWIETENEYKWIAKDPDGKFVMCNTEETRSADTYKLVCDSGKDYSKGLPL